MKPHSYLAALLWFAMLTPGARATEIFKANNTTALNQVGSWVSGGPAGSGDVAVWDATVTSSTNYTMGASLAWAGLKVLTPSLDPTIRPTSGQTLTLGSSGVDMSSVSTRNFTLNPVVVVGSNQTWNISTGRTLNVAALTGSGGTLTKGGSGLLKLTGPATYSGSLNLSAGNLETSNSTGIVELAGALSGSAPLNKTGAGFLTLSGNNSGYSGTISLSAGQLNLNQANVLGTSTLTITGGAFDNTSGAPVTLAGNLQNWNADTTFVGSNNLDLGVGSVTLSGNRVVTVTANTLLTSATFGGTGNLTKAGAGTLEIPVGSAVAMGGQVAVNAGDLKLTGGSITCASLVFGGSSTATFRLNGGTLSTGPISRTGGNATFSFNGGTLKSSAGSSAFMTGLTTASIAAGGAVVDPNGYFNTIAQPLLHDPALGSTPDGGLLVNDSIGNGQLTLTGTSTYTGTTIVQAGTLVLGAGGSIASSAVIDVQGSGTFDAPAGATISAGQTLQGTGTIIANITIAAGGNLSPSGATIGDLYAFNTLTLGGNATFQIDTTGIPISDRVSGLFQVVYGGTLTVTTTGPAPIDGSTFKLFDSANYSGAFASFNLPLLSTGLYWDTSSLTVDGTIKVINTLPTPMFNPPAGGYVGAQAVTITGLAGTTIHYTTDGSDPVTSGTVLSGPSPITGVVVPTDSTDFTLKAYVTMSGSTDSPVATAVYNTVNNAVWTLDGSGTWSVPLNWLFGAVPNGSGLAADFSTLTMSNSRTVTLDGSRSIGTLKFGDVGNFYGWTLSGTSTLTLDSGAATPVVTVDNQTTTINAPLSGSHGLAKSGTGTLLLPNANSLTGNVTVSQGMLRTGNNSAVGSGTITLGDTNSGTSPLGWQFNGGGQPANNIVVTNLGTGIVTLGTYSSGTFSATSGTLTLDRPVTINDQTADRTTYNGRISGNVGTITITGSRVTFGNAANDFTGNLVISPGSIYQNDSPTALPIATSLTNNGTFRMNNGGTHMLDAINGSGGATIIAGGNATLSVGNSGGSGTIGGVISNGSNVLTLVKNGAGTQVLAGANTYTGTTTVNGGALLVDGSLASASAVTVTATGTLGGIGNVAGTVACAGTLAPGNGGAGTLSTGALTHGGTYQCQLNGATCDLLAVTGNLNLTSSTLSVSTLPGGATQGTYLIATYSGTRTGSFTSVTPGYTVDYSTPNQIKLNVIAGYATWVAGFGLTGDDALKGSDPDHDGYNNLLEFATNSDPTTGGSGPRLYPLMHVIGGSKVLTYTAAVRKDAVFAAAANPNQMKQTATKDQVVYLVEASNDLAIWNVVDVTEVTGADATAVQTALGAKLTAQPIGADWQWHTFRTDGGANVDPSDFIRLKVSEAP